MLELTNSEASRLVSILDWVLVATLADQDEKTKIKNIRDKISNILKCEPNKKRIPMILDDNDETH